jgi:hypothetical protein
VSRKDSAPSRQLFDRQREAAERLRREVMGVDGSLDHPYFRALNKSCLGYRRAITSADVIERSIASGLVFIGDFHAVAANAEFVVDLLESLVSRKTQLCLGIEFVFTRQQRLLMRRQAGEIDDSTLHRRMHYREEWGYPWAGYRALLDCARAHGIPVEALDLPPRVGFGGLHRRDVHAGRRIADLVAADPEICMIVFYGESHITPQHLPLETEKALGKLDIRRDPLIVFQDPDSVYWQRVEERADLNAPVEIDDRTVAVFHTTPLEKYEAYRQVLDRWQSDLPQDEEIDLTPAVHHLIAVLAGWIGIRPGRRRLRHRAGWSEELVDAYPEVYSGPEAKDLLQPIFTEHGRSGDEIVEARRRLTDVGALYESRSNTMFLTRYLPGPAAGEAARFLRAALTGRLFISAEDFADDKSQTAYGAAYTEALAYLGARLVDPACDFGSGVRQAAGGSGGFVAEPSPGGWLEKHRSLEQSNAAEPDEPMCEALRGSRVLRRRLARELGGRLGAELVDRVRSGRLEKEGLRRLFIKPLLPAHAARDVFRLLRG